MVSFFLAFNLVVPLLLYMIVGMLIRKLNIMQEQTFKQMNNMIFRVILPVSLFFDIYQSTVYKGLHRVGI